MSKILIIDDMPVYREMIAEALSNAGFESFGAEDGEQGLDLFRVERPEIVITDLLMPRRDGFAVIQNLRRATPPVAIIAMSSDEVYLDVAIKFGADAVTMKPLCLRTMVALVHLVAEKILPARRMRHAAANSLSKNQSQLAQLGAGDASDCSGRHWTRTLQPGAEHYAVAQ